MMMIPDEPQGLPRLDAQNPWPGLAVYDEASQALFYGREADTAELLRLIRHAPLTVLYGKSGLGKSSLLQAGLFPKLRLEHFLPVYLHVDFSEKAAIPPFEQVARRLEAAIADAGADYPPRASEEGLWQYLHRKDPEIWSADNYPLTPVLVFDQLEELYSRGGGSRDHIQSVLESLADLIENRIPPAFAAADRMAWEQMDLFTQRYRILLAFREEFLPEFETWKDKVPSLLHNRMRLLPMSRDQAIAAIRQAGATVLADEVAECIVDLVANDKTKTYDREDTAAKRETGTSDSETFIEPVLLSLCCYQLNLKRLQAHADKIDPALVAGSGQNILEDFYHEAIAGMPENVPQFIENHLIDGEHYRGSFPLRDAIKCNYIQKEELDRLIGKFRLLRVNQQADTARIELIHDRMVGVVYKSLEKRRMREREQENERRRKEEEREKLARIDRERLKQSERDRLRLANMRNLLFVAVLGLLVLTGIVAYQTKIARDQRLRATGLCLAAEAQAMLSGVRIGSDEQAFVQLLAAFHISTEAETKVKAVFLDTLLTQRDLVKLIMTGGSVLAAAFSADDTRIVSAGKDHLLQRWDAATGRFIDRLKMDSQEAASCLAFSPDDRHIVSASGDKGPRMWNAVTGKPAGEMLAGRMEAASCVAFSPDGARIILASREKDLRLWDVATGRLICEPMAGHKEPISCVAFSPDGTRIVSGSKDKTLRLWDADTGRLICKPMTGHKEPVSCVAFSPDGTRIISGGWDKDLRLWDADSGQSIGRQQLAHKGAVNSVAFSHDGTRIVSGGEDNLLRLWDANLSAPLIGHKDTVNSVAFSPDGTCIVSGSADKTLRLWDAKTRKPIGEALTGHNDGVESVTFNHDGTRIVTGSADGTLRLWNAKTRKPIGEALAWHKKGVNSAAFSPDGSYIVSGSQDCTLRIWDADTHQPVGEPIKGHQDEVKSVAFSPDGRRIVSASGDKTLRLWDAFTGQPSDNPLKGHDGWVMSTAFSPDGRHIVSGSWDNTLRLWDAAAERSIGEPLKGHEDSVTSVAFSPDGTRIVSGGRDATLRLWETAELLKMAASGTGQPISLTLQGHKGKVQSVAFSPDGSLIVSGSCGDNTLRLWPVPKDLPGELCKKLTRNMSRRQWREWVSPEIGYKVQCPDLPIPPDDPP